MPFWYRRAMTSLPREGRPHHAILDDLASLRQGDAKWREGRVMSLVYDGGEAHQELLKQAYSLYFSENGLNPMAFKSLRRMEADVVRITAGLFHGGPDTVGTLTSGGTESILLAVKAARERAHARGFRGKPELVVPKSAHVAFDKAAHYFGLRIRHVPLGDDFRVDLRELRRAIGRNTVLVAASAPQYPHGVIDPIGAIAEVTRERGVPFHPARGPRLEGGRVRIRPPHGGVQGGPEPFGLAPHEHAVHGVELPCHRVEKTGRLRGCPVGTAGQELEGVSRVGNAVEPAAPGHEATRIALAAKVVQQPRVERLDFRRREKRRGRFARGNE